MDTNSIKIELLKEKRREISKQWKIDNHDYYVTSQRARMSKKYHEDHEYREKQKQAALERYYRKKAAQKMGVA